MGNRQGLEESEEWQSCRRRSLRLYLSQVENETGFTGFVYSAISMAGVFDPTKVVSILFNNQIAVLVCCCNSQNISFEAAAFLNDNMCGTT